MESAGVPAKLLSEEAKREIFAILAAGGSRQAAAKAAGLSEAEFHTLFLSDTEFSTKVRDSEHQAELFFLMRIREATKSSSGWRAAAWWLERRRGEQFGSSRKDLLSPEEVEKAFFRLFEVIRANVKSEKVFEKILKEGTAVLDRLNS